MSYNACSYNYPLSPVQFADLKELFPDELKLKKPEELNLVSGAMQRIFPRSGSVNYLVLGADVSGSGQHSRAERVVLLHNEVEHGTSTPWTVAAVMGLADGSPCPKLPDLLHEGRSLREHIEKAAQAA